MVFLVLKLLLVLVWFSSFPLCIVLMVFSPTYLPAPFLCGTLYMEKRVRNNSDGLSVCITDNFVFGKLPG